MELLYGLLIDQWGGHQRRFCKRWLGTPHSVEEGGVCYRGHTAWLLGLWYFPLGPWQREFQFDESIKNKRWKILFAWPNSLCLKIYYNVKYQLCIPRSTCSSRYLNALDTVKSPSWLPNILSTEQELTTSPS